MLAQNVKVSLFIPNKACRMEFNLVESHLEF